jgi:hypothetical protein
MVVAIVRPVAGGMVGHDKIQNYEKKNMTQCSVCTPASPNYIWIVSMDDPDGVHFRTVSLLIYMEGFGEIVIRACVLV